MSLSSILLHRNCQDKSAQDRDGPGGAHFLDEPPLPVLTRRAKCYLSADLRISPPARQRTILLVSHSMEDIGRVADRVLVMNNAHAEMYDETRAVFSRGELLEPMGLRLPQIVHYAPSAQNG